MKSILNSSLVILLAGASVLSVPARAQDAESISRFAGAHVTIEGGIVDNHVRQPGAPSTSGMKHYANFAAVRGAIGYDIAPVNGLIVGVEAGIGTTGRSFNQASIAGGRYRFKPGLTYDVTARIGLVPVANVMLYGRAGYRRMRNEREISGQVAGNGITKRKDGGFTYGGGIEYAVSREFSLRAEVNRTKFDKNMRQNRISVGGSLRF
ncbi:MAG: outer membrane beta-barrel protein [Candidatus Sphingomonas phytovorans]|nr:outer membrane beta-barrel protein [Sphingomonas sp.]WEK00145.1 MAG: outer membrane beta-barrel protein [Sphingomonas sp.]